VQVKDDLDVSTVDHLLDEMSEAIDTARKQVGQQGGCHGGPGPWFSPITPA
jgi:hypothetical protein